MAAAAAAAAAAAPSEETTTHLVLELPEFFPGLLECKELDVRIQVKLPSNSDTHHRHSLSSEDVLKSLERKGDDKHRARVRISGSLCSDDVLTSLEKNGTCSASALTWIRAMREAKDEKKVTTRNGRWIVCFAVTKSPTSKSIYACLPSAGAATHCRPPPLQPGQRACGGPAYLMQRIMYPLHTLLARTPAYAEFLRKRMHSDSNKKRLPATGGKKLPSGGMLSLTSVTAARAAPAPAAASASAAAPVMPPPRPRLMRASVANQPLSDDTAMAAIEHFNKLRQRRRRR